MDGHNRESKRRDPERNLHDYPTIQHSELVDRSSPIRIRHLKFTRMHSRVDILIVRLLRLGVVAMASTVPLAGGALDRLDDGHRILASATMWSTWAVCLLSVLVPASSSLTALRLAIPTHLSTSILVAATSGIDAAMAVAIAIGSIVFILAMSAETGAYFIQSSAYGDERRFPLRCPRSHLAVIVIAWSIWFAAGALGTIALAAGTALASLLVAVALAAFAALPRRFHRYSRRWLVSVPAGLVIHDYLLLTETAMFPRRVVAGVEAWPQTTSPDDTPFDLTGGAARTGIVLRLRDSETIILAPTKEHPGGRAFHVRSLRMCPTRIARALRSLGSQG